MATRINLASSEGSDYSITGRGIEFVLTFKNRATKALREAGSQMEQLARGAGAFLQQVKTSSQQAVDSIFKIQKEGDKTPGYVTAFGASTKTIGLLQQAWAATTKLGTTIADKLRGQAQWLRTVSEATDAQTRKTDELTKSQKNADKSTESLIGRLGKLAAEAYVVKKALDYAINAAAETMELNHELSRLRIGITPTNQLSQVGPRTEKDMQNILLLQQRTRASTEEILEGYRTIINLGKQLDDSSMHMIQRSVEFGRMTGVSVSALLPLHQRFIDTLNISADRVGEFTEKLNAEMVAVKNAGKASFPEVIARVENLMNVSQRLAQQIGANGRLSDRQIEDLTKRLVLNGAAAQGVAEKYGMASESLTGMMELMQQRGTAEMHQMDTFITMMAQLKPGEFQGAVERGDYAKIFEAMGRAAEKVTALNLPEYYAEIAKFTGWSNQDTVMMARHWRQIAGETKEAQENIAGVKPGDWSKMWAEFSSTLGEKYKNVVTFFDLLKKEFGQGVLDTLGGVLTALDKLIEKFHLIDENGKLSGVGEAVQGIGRAAGWVMPALATLWAAPKIVRALRFVGILGETAKVAGTATTAVEGIAGAAASVEEALLGVGAATEALGAAAASGGILGLLANPVTWGVAALVVAGVAVYVYRDQIKEAFEGAKMFADDFGTALKHAWDTSVIGQWMDAAAKAIDRNTPKAVQDWWQRGEAAKRLAAAPHGHRGDKTGHTTPAPTNPIDAFAQGAADRGGLLSDWHQAQIKDKSMLDHIERLMKAGFTRDQAIQATAKTFPQLSAPEAETNPSQQISDIIAAQVAGRSANQPPATVENTQRGILSNILSGPEKPIRVDNREVTGAIADQTAQQTKLLEQIRDALARPGDDNVARFRRLQD